MKTVDIETRISIRRMLKSPDKDTSKLGWIMFVNEYQEEIIRRVRMEHYPSLIYKCDAIEFLNKSIAQSKRYL